MHPILIAAAVFFTEEIVFRNYGHRMFAPTAECPGVELVVPEFDDDGRMWARPPHDRQAPIDALNGLTERVRKTAAEGDTAIVVFLHGWHHNAAEKDTNLRSFCSTLRSVHELVNDPAGEYWNWRVKFTGRPQPTMKVLGIYVGWRGKSAPMPLDYITFYGRKAAAERIGRGDVPELLLRLHAIYAKQNETPRPDGTPSVTNLISVGHSFGGALLLSAVAPHFNEALVKAADAHRKGAAEVMIEEGLGDLVVLVNPAVEAAQYDTIDVAARALPFAAAQPPLMLVVDSESDLARRFWFPVGRGLGLLSHSTRAADESKMIRKALGVYDPQVNRCLYLQGKQPCAAIPPSPAPASQPRQQRPPAASFPGLVLETARPRAVIGKRELSEPTELEPTRDDESATNPFVVARATDAVISGHNGVFDKNFVGFLLSYAAKASAIRLEARAHPSTAARVKAIPMTSSN